MTKDPGEETPRRAGSDDTGTPLSTPAADDDPLATAASRGDDPLGMFANDADSPAEKADKGPVAGEEPGPLEPSAEAKHADRDEQGRRLNTGSVPLEGQDGQEPTAPGAAEFAYVRAEPRASDRTPAIDLRGVPAASARDRAWPPRSAARPSVEAGTARVSAEAASNDGATEPTATSVSDLVAQVRAVAAGRDGGQDMPRPVPSQVPPADWRLSPPAAPSRRVTARWLYVVGGLVVVAALAFGGWRVGRGLVNQPAASPVPQEGRLTIESLPTGAQVEIDGVPKGATPLGVALKPGRHVVRVGGPSGREIDVVMAAGAQVSHHIDLPDLRTRLHIDTVPPAATVWVDGQRRGQAPLDVTDLSPGTHAVMAEAGGAAVRRNVEVHPGAANSAVIALSGGGPTTGWVTVAAPFDVEVYEGSRLVGRSADGQMLLVAGSHDLTLANADLEFRLASSVTVTAGRTSTIRVQPVNGRLSVNATPWAEVLLDGNRIGETPIANYTTSIGRHEIVFRHPQYPEQRKTIVVTAASPTRVFATFAK